MKLAIYGAGGLGREIYELSRQIGRWEDIYFIDDTVVSDEDYYINGVKTLHYTSAVTLFPKDGIEFVIALGEPEYRKKLYEKVKSDGFNFTTLIHPGVYISSSTKLGEGVIIQTNAVLTCNIEIGCNTLIQNTATVGHDTKIGRHCVVSANDVVAGHCNIGDCVYIGLNVPVRENISIGSDSIIGMGSVVLKDIPGNVIAMGNPARAMKNKDDRRVFN